jgi:hypothetical protein
MNPSFVNSISINLVVLMFLDAQPTDGEQETFEEVQRVLRNSEPILEEIQCYKGAGKEIREVSTCYSLMGWTSLLGPLNLKSQV